MPYQFLLQSNHVTHQSSAALRSNQNDGMISETMTNHGEIMRYVRIGAVRHTEIAIGTLTVR